MYAHRLSVSLFENTYEKNIISKESISLRIEKLKNRNAGAKNRWALSGREIHGISRMRRKEVVSSSYMSHLEFNAIRWERKKEKEKEEGGKRKTIIGESEARGKRMGFNIASSTEPGDSYNGGARGLAKPYRLWVRDSTE